MSKQTHTDRDNWYDKLTEMWHTIGATVREPDIAARDRAMDRVEATVAVKRSRSVDLKDLRTKQHTDSTTGLGLDSDLVSHFRLLFKWHGMSCR